MFFPTSLRDYRRQPWQSLPNMSLRAPGGRVAISLGKNKKRLLRRFAPRNDPFFRHCEQSKGLRGNLFRIRHCEATKWPWQSLPNMSLRAPGGRVAISLGKNKKRLLRRFAPRNDPFFRHCEQSEGLRGNFKRLLRPHFVRARNDVKE